MAMLADPDALPQVIGDYEPIDRWQVHINKLFYALRGGRLREFYQTFSSGDYRLAHALAADYYEAVQKRKKKASVGGTASAPSRQSSSPHASPLTPNGPLVIHEWGCGNGNLAACFLSYLKSIDKEGGVYPRVQYVLVDSQEDVLEAAKSHPDLAEHQEHLETICGDATGLRAVKDGTVDRVFCNELWNDLPTKLMLRKDAEFEEEFVRPNLKEHRYAAVEDWSAFVRAFDAADIDALRTIDPFLDDIIWEKEYRKVEWKDVPFRKTISEILKKIDEHVLVPINVGAAETLSEAKRVLSADAVGFSSFDAGTNSLELLNDPDKPCYGQFGGQFSFMVNFVLLEAVAAYLGAKGVKTEPQREFVGRALKTNVATLMDLLALHPSAASMKSWEQDRLTLQTILALNKRYRSPYKRKIEFPIREQLPPREAGEIAGLLASLDDHGVPDTIAYLTEEELLAAGPDLEELGYDRQALPAALAVPPQGVDYTHLFFGAL